MRKVVAVSAPSFVRSAELMAELRGHGFEVVANGLGREMSEGELVELLTRSGAEAVIVGRDPVTGAVLEACPRLRFVAKYGVGLDNVDEAALAARGVGLGWTGGVNRRAVAELVMGFMLGHLRNVQRSVVRLREGRWEKDGGVGLEGLTVGIVGFGFVGAELARMVGPWGCRVVYCDIVDRASEAAVSGAEAALYEEVVKRADVLTFHVPLTAATRGMFGERELGMVKKTVLVVNTARGEVVDFAATCRAVMAGRIGGFAADVFSEEPVDLRGWADERLYFTPHIGGNSRQAVRAMGAAAVGHVVRYFAERGAGD